MLRYFFWITRWYFFFVIRYELKLNSESSIKENICLIKKSASKLFFFNFNLRACNTLP